MPETADRRTAIYQLDPPRPARPPSAASIVAAVGLAGCGFLVLLGVGGFFLVRAVLPGLMPGRYGFYEHNRAGNAYYRQGLYKRAIAEYAQMAAQYPNRPEGYFFQAMAYYRLHDPDRAIAMYNAALQRQSYREQKAETHYNLGLCYRAKHDWRRSVTQFTTSLDMGGENSDAYYWRAMEYAEGGNLPAASADFGRVIARKPAEPYAYEQRAEIERRTKAYAKAEADQTAAARLKPNDANAWGNLSWTQYLVGDVPGAIESNKQALALAPMLGYARFNQGLYFAVQGDWPSAQQDYAQALRHAPPADAKAALDDVENALKAHPGSAALRKAEALLKPAAGSARTVGGRM